MNETFHNPATKGNRATSIMRRSILIAASGLLVAASVAAVAKETVKVGYFPNPNPEKIAIAKKWFERDMGTDVKWVPLQSGGPAMAALASKALDIVSAIGNPAIATSAAHGIAFKVIWVNENSAEALVAKPEIKMVSDLAGKNVGTPFGSTSQFTLMGALALNNVDSSKVKIYDMEPPDIVAAWKRGDLQGAYVWQPFLGQMIGDGGHVLVTSSEMATKGYPVFDAVIVRDDFAQAHHSVVQGFVNAEAEGVRFYRTHPKEAYAVIGKTVGISTEEAEKESKSYVFPSAEEQASPMWLGKPGDCKSVVADGLRTTAKWLVSTKAITSAPNSYCKWVDPSYAAAAK
jgi:taurine ABC transporter substrate-binding protein